MTLYTYDELNGNGFKKKFNCNGYWKFVYDYIIEKQDLQIPKSGKI